LEVSFGCFIGLKSHTYNFDDGYVLHAVTRNLKLFEIQAGDSNW